MPRRYPLEIFSLIITILLLIAIIIFFTQFSFYTVIFITVISLLYIRLQQGIYIGNSIQITKEQFPNIWSTIEKACTILNMDRPNVHVTQDPYLNAFTIGFKYPYSIVITSGLLEVFTEDEINFVICHEIGHIKFRHSFFLSILYPAGNQIPIIGFLFTWWGRKCEYSADRMGLYLTQKLQPAITSFIKLTSGGKLAKGIDLDKFLSQSEDINRNLFNKYGELLLNHPYTVNRIFKINNFYRDSIRY